jgi:hypothetical protein
MFLGGVAFVSTRYSNMSHILLLFLKKPSKLNWYSNNNGIFKGSKNSMGGLSKDRNRRRFCADFFPLLLGGSCSKIPKKKEERRNLS